MEAQHQSNKRPKKTTTEGIERKGVQTGEEVAGVEEEEEANEVAPLSEEMEASIQAILERIERFTQQVSELLETGKTMFNNLSTQFEERLISIHRDQVEKWQEEMKELRSLDASNEAARALLQNAQLHLFQSVTEGRS